MEYRVKWKGYDDGENQWLPHYNVHADDKVAEFYRLHPGAPRQIRAAYFDMLPFRSRADESQWWRSSRRGGET